MSDNIEIVLNGLKTKIAPNISIAQLICSMNEHDLQIIVECNGKFIFPQKYSSTLIYDGDNIELINPDFGG
jgi:thiamine biosynthesis protein ThiS